MKRQPLLSISRISRLWLCYAGKMRKKCVQMKLSRDYYETQINEEKEVQETWIKNRDISEEFREESRNTSRTLIQVQACRQKINITSGCLQHFYIQEELGGVSAGCCVELSAGSWLKLPAHPKRIEMSSRRPADRDEPRIFLEVYESQLFDSLLSAISDGMILEFSGGELMQSWDW